MKKAKELLDKLLEQEQYLHDQLLMTRGGIQALQKILESDTGEILEKFSTEKKDE